MKRNSRFIVIFFIIALFPVVFILNQFDLFAGWIKFNSIETKSALIDKENIVWKITARQPAENPKIENTFILDENNRFGLYYEKFITDFYKTSDGGTSWEKQSTLKDFNVTDFYFISPNEGFLAANKLKPSSFPMDNGCLVMKTEDGGKNWENVFNDVNCVFNKINFDKDGIGIVVGRKDVTKPVMDSNHFVLISKDKGKTWTDISEKLNLIEVSPQKQVADFSTNVIFSKKYGIVILSSKGKIYKTLDESKSWSLVSKVMDEPAQTGFRDLGILPDETIWIGGGAATIEGHWGVIALMNSRSGWESNRLNGYYFSDVEFVSNNEVIAAGRISNFGGKDEEPMKGVILYSTDRGKNWTTLYKTQTKELFTAIYRISAKKYLITSKTNEEIILEGE